MRVCGARAAEGFPHPFSPVQERAGVCTRERSPVGGLGPTTLSQVLGGLRAARWRSCGGPAPARVEGPGQRLGCWDRHFCVQGEVWPGGFQGEAVFTIPEPRVLLLPQRLSRPA